MFISPTKIWQFWVGPLPVANEDLCIPQPKRHVKILAVDLTSKKTIQGMARHCNLWSYLRSDQSFFHSDQGTYWPHTKCSANSCCSSPNKRSAIWNCSNAGAMGTTILRSLPGLIWGGWFACCNRWFPISETGTQIQFQHLLRMVSFSFIHFVQFHESLKFDHIAIFSPMSSNQNSLANLNLDAVKEASG